MPDQENTPAAAATNPAAAPEPPAPLEPIQTEINHTLRGIGDRIQNALRPEQQEQTLEQRVIALEDEMADHFPRHLGG